MDIFCESLDFPKVLSLLADEAVSQAAKDALLTLSPAKSEQTCRRLMEETTAARRVLDAAGSPPLPMMDGLEEAIALAVIGGMLSPALLMRAALFVSTCRRMRQYLSRAEAHSAAIASYRGEIADLGSLEAEITRCVTEDGVCDEASPALRALRRQREILDGRVHEKLGSLVNRYKSCLADGYATLRGGRHVLPVLRKFQGQFPGSVVDASASGGTVFMEPDAIRLTQNELDVLQGEIDTEERRVLYTLSAAVADAEDDLRRAMKLMTELDMLFARAKLSARMKGVPAELTSQRQIRLTGARHPLLDPGICVPLDFRLDAPDTGVIVTGPNTGGKTVALKTVGLMTLMAQCGLHLPCDPGSRLALCDTVLCDIGDSQSIAQNLSTFSGHMTRVIDILRRASRDSLVLLDELGSGTDPAEGMGIAVAVLEELRLRGCLMLATTHDPQVKAYAESAERIVAARMAFDRDTLRPLYRLEMGKSGESCALTIAARLGMPEALLVRARRAAYDRVLPSGDGAPVTAAPRSELVRMSAAPRPDFSGKFAMGDSVALPGGETGIVFRPCDEDGNVIVQVKGEKRAVRHNRLTLRAPAAQLYPPDYDFSIVFDTVANRKAAHQMARKFDPDAVIVHEEGTENTSD